MGVSASSCTSTSGLVVDNISWPVPIPMASPSCSLGDLGQKIISLGQESKSNGGGDALNDHSPFLYIAYWSFFKLTQTPLTYAELLQLWQCRSGPKKLCIYKRNKIKINKKVKATEVKNNVNFIKPKQHTFTPSQTHLYLWIYLHFTTDAKIKVHNGPSLAKLHGPNLYLCMRTTWSAIKRSLSLSATSSMMNRQSKRESSESWRPMFSMGVLYWS